MRRRPLLLALLLSSFFPLLASLARADFFSQSPGPLSAAHQGLDGRDRCGACHTDGRALADERCLGCHDHDPIRRRIAAGKGLHASDKVAGKACYLCHTEHKGRSRDILGFAALGGRDRFAHDLTGFPLAGAHAAAACERCHDRRGAAGRVTYLGAPTTCAGCHRSPHGELRPSLGCERCHDVRAWAARLRPKFDHDSPADARFPLEAKHAAVPCLRCHDKWRFRMPGVGRAEGGAGWQPDCVPCHDNVHGDGLFGRKRCALCHSAKVDWHSVRFDHARHTRFPLDGAHAGRPCATCHGAAGPGHAEKAPSRACASCHADVHRGRFAAQGDCAACHASTTFRADLRFDHGARTRFPLAGAHADVDCRACHRGAGPAEWERFDARSVGCMGCHQHAEVHKRQFGDAECLRCHVGAGKKKFKREALLRVHGPSSPFPLTEGHVGVACDKCHQRDVYQGTPTVCGPACHPDELHRGSLGKDCLRCHEGGHFAATRFDHDQTAFPLVGHHQEARCEDCHPARRFSPTPRRCHECHGQDDAHQGTLGVACERCHSPTGRSLFDHNDPRVPGRFRLVGEHRAVRCQACHPTTVFPRAPAACEGCHGEPAVHRGELGTRCADCHDANGWSRIHTGHETGAFHFGGAHDRVRCSVCHPGGRALRGSGERCLDCHRRDDLHRNSLGPRCGECHGQQTFAGGRFWHERVGCDLRGVHRTLPCRDCHAGGNFAALSPACVACHRADAVRGAANRNAPPGHAGFAACASCHNVSFFVPARPSGTESVCR